MNMNNEEFKHIFGIIQIVLMSTVKVYPVMAFLYNVMNYTTYIYQMSAIDYYDQDRLLPDFVENPNNESLDDWLANNIIKVIRGEYTISDGWLLQKYMRDRHMWTDSDEQIRTKVHGFGYYSKLREIRDKVNSCSQTLLGVVPSKLITTHSYTSYSIPFDKLKIKVKGGTFKVARDIEELTKYLIVTYIIETTLRNYGFYIVNQIDYVNGFTHTLKDRYKYDYDFHAIVKYLLDKCFDD